MSDDVLVLWDIDGTLLNAGGVGRDLYGDVFLQLFGRSLTAHAPMSGRTDRAVILETLELAGVDEPRRHVDPFIASLGAHAQAVHAAVAARGQALPGAAEALAAVAAARSFGASRPVGAGTTGVPARGISTLSLPDQPSPVPAFSARSSAFAAAGPAGVPAAAMSPAAMSPAAMSPGASTPPAAQPLASPAAAAAAAAAHGGPATVRTMATPAVAQAAGPLAGSPVAGAQPSAGAAALVPPAAAAALAQLVPPQASGARALASHRTAPAAGPRTAAPRGASTVGRPKRRVYQSVLTGSIRPVAEMKLAALGLRDGLDLCIGAYGDDHEDRTQLVHVARRRAAGVHGQNAAAFSGTATVIVGDTPLDVSAALDAGARVVGVASGAYSADDLRAAGAQVVLTDLVDTAVVLRALFG
jgi:phosphoglycolate phosphatase-like HAD superfamily hydrolase